MQEIKNKMIVKKRNNIERMIQTSIFDWARYQRVKEGGFLYDYMTASPNGGTRNLIEAVNLKRSGVSAGFPDVSILIARGKWHGMFLEIKRHSKSPVSKKQYVWLSRLLDAGYYAEVGCGFDECQNLIESYVKII